jgi:hypothetical protein
MGNKGLTGTLFAPQGAMNTQKDLKKAHRQFYIEGMDRLRILTLDEAAEHPPVPPELGPTLTIESAARFFPRSPASARKTAREVVPS